MYSSGARVTVPSCVRVGFDELSATEQPTANTGTCHIHIRSCAADGVAAGNGVNRGTTFEEAVNTAVEDVLQAAYSSPT